MYPPGAGGDDGAGAGAGAGVLCAGAGAGAGEAARGAGAGALCAGAGAGEAELGAGAALCAGVPNLWTGVGPVRAGAEVGEGDGTELSAEPLFGAVSVLSVCTGSPASESGSFAPPQAAKPRTNASKTAFDTTPEAGALRGSSSEHRNAIFMGNSLSDRPWKTGFDNYFKELSLKTSASVEFD